MRFAVSFAVIAMSISGCVDNDYHSKAVSRDSSLEITPTHFSTSFDGSNTVDYAGNRFEVRHDVDSNMVFVKPETTPVQKSDLYAAASLGGFCEINDSTMAFMNDGEMIGTDLILNTPNGIGFNCS